MKFLTRLCFVLVLMALAVAPVMAQEELTETFTSESGALSFQYPAGWIVQESFGSVEGANSQAALDAADEDLNAEYFQFFAIGGAASDLGVAAGGSAMDVLALFTESMSDESVTFTEPVSGKAGDFETASITGSDDTVSAVIMVVKVADDAFVLFAGASAVGALETYQPTLEAMAATVQFDAALAAAASPDFSSSTEFDATAFAPAVAGTGSIVWQQQTEMLYDSRSFGSVGSVEVGADDTIYVADGSNGIVTLSPDGTVTGAIYNNEFFSLSDVAIAADGTFWVADEFNNKVYNIDATGAILNSFGEAGTGDGQFGTISPSQIELGPDGNLYVYDSNTDATENSIGRVQVFDTAGTFVRSFQLDANDEFGFDYDVKITFAPDGNLWVADYFGNIRAYDAEGNIVVDTMTIESLSFAAIGGLDVDAEGNLYVAADNGVITKLDSKGTVLAQTGTEQESPADGNYVAFEPGQFYGPTGLALLSNGDVVVADTNYTFSQVVRVNLAAQ